MPTSNPIATTLRVMAMVPLFVSAAVCEAQSTTEKAQMEWKRLDEMSKSITAPEYVGRDAEQDLAAIMNLAPFRQHIVDISKQFAAEIKADNQPFRNLGIILANFKSDLSVFEASAKQFCSSEVIQEDLDHILHMTKLAVENQAPAYFRTGNDIQRRTEMVKQRIRYSQSLSPNSAEAKSATRKLDELTKQVREFQTSLAASILEQNEVPPDMYRGNDREALLALLLDKWTKEGNKSPPLKFGIVTPDWTRSVSWEIQNQTLYKNDRSRIQGYVLVQINSKVAARHSINLVKDHLNNDKIVASFLSDPKLEPDLINQVLLSKVK